VTRIHALSLAALILVAILISASPAPAAPVWYQSSRPDGSRIDWALDLPADTNRHGLIVIAQGSGCLPVAQSENIALVRQVFAGFAALTVEKYGIEIDAEIADPFAACPAPYHAHNTATQRVADYRQIVEELADAPWWDGKLVLFGGSMGGSVMADLAPQVDPDAAIYLSTGGGVTFGEMVLLTVPEEARPVLEAQFVEMRAHPDSTQLWAGYSYRFWVDALDRREVDDMLKTNAPLLLIQGTRDTSSPVSIARIVADRFAEAGRTNLTYWEYPGYDHTMEDSQERSHMRQVLEDAARWLESAVKQDR
jgi:dienelactone hydrolase